MSTASIRQLRVCYLSLHKNLPDTSYKIQLLHYYENADPYVWPVRLVVGILSVLVSLVNVAVFTRKHMRRSSLNLLLIALEVSNVLLCVFQTMFAAVELVNGDYATSIHVALLIIVCSRVTFFSATFINWISGIISFWRYLAIRQPLKAKTRLSRYRAVWIILITFLVTLSPHFLNIVTNEIVRDDYPICSDLQSGNNTTLAYYYLGPTDWSYEHPVFMTCLQRGMIIVFYALPILFLFVMTVCLLSTICSYSKRQGSLREGQSQVYIEERQTRTTAILIALLGLYVFSNSVEVVIGHLFEIESYQQNLNLMKASLILQGSFLTQVTNVFSIFAYYSMGTNFRGTLHELFSRKRK